MHASDRRVAVDPALDRQQLRGDVVRRGRDRSMVAIGWDQCPEVLLGVRRLRQNLEIGRKDEDDRAGSDRPTSVDRRGELRAVHRRRSPACVPGATPLQPG